jgi:hypothetical protein
MEMMRPVISSQNAVVASNDDPLTRPWVGHDRIQCGQVFEADAPCAAMTVWSTITTWSSSIAHGQQ